MSAICIVGYHTVHAVLLSAMNSVFHHSYNEIIRIHLISYLHRKLVSWNFINNQLTVRLTSFSSQHYSYIKMFAVGLSPQDNIMCITI